jgi:hypothetical protein
MAPLNLKRSGLAAPPPKHVIAEYRHRTRTVTCVCGWQGSSAEDVGRSEWSLHIAENRAPGRTSAG